MSNNPWLALSLKSEDDTPKKSAKPVQVAQAKRRELAPDQAMCRDIKVAADIVELVADLPSSSDSKVMMIARGRYWNKIVPSFRLFRPDAPFDVNASIPLSVFLRTKVRDFITNEPILIVRRFAHKEHIAIPHAIVAPLNIQLPPDANIVNTPYVFDDAVDMDIYKIPKKGPVDLNLLQPQRMESDFSQLVSPQGSRVLQLNKVSIARIHSVAANLVPAKSIHWSTFKGLDREKIDALFNEVSGRPIGILSSNATLGSQPATIALMTPIL